MSYGACDQCGNPLTDGEMMRAPQLCELCSRDLEDSEIAEEYDEDVA